MLPERGLVRLGAEIEVAAWKTGSSFQKVAEELIDMNYMYGPLTQWAAVHKWRCECVPGGCGFIRSGQIVDPPLVAIGHDATLPKNGAEFIMSPVLMMEDGLPHFRRIWETVAKHAVWRNDIPDLHGRDCSPSVHMHVSVAKGPSKTSRDRGTFTNDALTALSLFSPEFFALASVVDERRGLTYRLPDKESMATHDNGMHHGFVQVRSGSRGNYLHIEWRLFEAAYRDWKYIESASYLAAGLTRALLEEHVFSALMSTGYAQPHSDAALMAAVKKNDVNAVLAQVNPERLETLRQVVMQSLNDDAYAAGRVGHLFGLAGAG